MIPNICVIFILYENNTVGLFVIKRKEFDIIDSTRVCQATPLSTNAEILHKRNLFISHTYVLCPRRNTETTTISTRGMYVLIES